MDSRSKYLFGAFGVIFLLSALWGYRIFFVTEDFIVQTVTECDPIAERCFISCDSADCKDDYYKKITKRAYTVPDCDATVEECEPLMCKPDELECEITYCAPDTVQGDEVCTNPKDFEKATVKPAEDIDFEPLP